MADDAEAMQVDGEDEPVYPRSGVVFDAVVPDGTSAYKWLVPQLKEAGITIQLKDGQPEPVPDEMWVLQQIVTEDKTIYRATSTLVRSSTSTADESCETWTSKWEEPHKMLGIRLQVVDAPSVESVTFNNLTFLSQWQRQASKAVTKQHHKPGYKFKLGQGAFARTTVPQAPPVPFVDTTGVYNDFEGLDPLPQEEGMVMGEITGFTIDAIYDWTTEAPQKGATLPPFKEVSIVIHLQSAACEYLLVSLEPCRGTWNQAIPHRPLPVVLTSSDSVHVRRVSSAAGELS
jgi:hypothetical protein